MRHSAALDFEYADPEDAASVAASLRPEIGDIEGDRTTARLECEGAAITVTIDAADLVALRAGINTWTTLVSVAERARCATAVGIE